MFLPLILLLLMAAGIHAVRLPAKTPARVAELVLRYVLAGYCGIPMVLLSAALVIVPERAMDYLHVSGGGMALAFLSWAYLALSLAALLALRYRGRALLAPAMAWGTFFAGATVVHVREFLAHGQLTFPVALHTFATHALVSLVLWAGVIAGGATERAP